MIGRENDIRLASELREAFIKQYNDDRTFALFLEKVKEDYEERFIHKAAKELKINIVRNYKLLKPLVDQVENKSRYIIFSEACKVAEARKWINDNGKYEDIIAEVFYDFYKKEVEVLKIGKNA